MNIVFMGTPDIAAHCLDALLAQGRHTVCAVYTREDKPVGRRQILTAPPVKQLAVQHGIEVLQPRTLRADGSADTLRALNPDLVVVVAYGRILPPEILQVPKYGCINLHVSLLPRYRGAAPVQWAVLNGDRETGVTIMQLDEGLDTGDILAVEKISIGEEETSGELFDRVTETGAALLLRTIDDIEAGRVHPTPQNDADATLAPPLNKEMARFDFSISAQKLHAHILGMNPWPAAYFEHGAKKIKVLRARVTPGKGVPGTVLSAKPLVVACGDGALTLDEVVPEGSRPMDGAAWAAGRRFSVGDSVYG